MKNLLTTRWLAATALLLGILAGLPAAAVGDEAEVRFHEEMVAMPDGVGLETHVFRPQGEGPFPVVLCRSPYSVERRAWLGESLAAEGFATVLQSVRGKGDSEGIFFPFVNEQRDGEATVNWIVEQPWSNGKVALWGVSYHGYTAFELARTGHPAIGAVFHISGWSDLSKFLAHGGAFQLQAHLKWYYTFGPGQGRPEPSAEAWRQILRTVPLSDFFRGAEAVWEHASRPYDHNDIKVPIMHVTGWYDYIYPNVLQTYAAMKETSLSPKQRLIIGPWSHNGVLSNWTKVGDEEFGDAASAGFDWAVRRAAQWFRHVLNGEENDLTGSAPVSYFVMNENRWVDDEVWPPSRAEFRNWYLLENGGLSTSEPGAAGTSQFVFDPDNPVPTVGGANSHFFPDNLGPKDQAGIGSREDVVTFTSAPLKEPMTIAGPITAVVYASTTGKNTDFAAVLSAVRPDGYARKLEGGIVRASHLFEGDATQGYVIPGEVYRYDIECGATAIALKAGERLQVTISSSSFPKYDRNPNTGADPLSASEFVKATQTVHHSTVYPSHIVLPVLSGKANQPARLQQALEGRTGVEVSEARSR